MKNPPYRLFIFGMLVVLFSCNIEKRIAKQQKTFDNIGRAWLKLHPCANDSTYIYLPGKVDSVPIEVPILVIDSAYTEKQIDSLQKYYASKKDCSQEIKSAYNLGYSESTKKWKSATSQIKVPLPVIDTVKISIKDKQQIKLLQDDLADCNTLTQQLQLDNAKEKGKSDKWFLWFVIASILLGISSYFNVKKL